jgi:hypothetical protein
MKTFVGPAYGIERTNIGAIMDPAETSFMDEELLLDFCYEVDGFSNFADIIVNRWETNQRFGGVDGRIMLSEMLSSLAVLTGSKKSAIDWVMNSCGYTDVVKSDVCSNFEYGDFWTLASNHEWLKVIEAYRDTCPEFIEAVFRTG